MFDTLPTPATPLQGQLYVTEAQRIVRVQGPALMPDESTPAVLFSVIAPTPDPRTRVLPLTEFGGPGARFELVIGAETGAAAKMLAAWVPETALTRLLAAIAAANPPYRTIAWLDSVVTQAQQQGRPLTAGQALGLLAFCATAVFSESASHAVLHSLENRATPEAGATAADYAIAHRCVTALFDPLAAQEDEAVYVRDLAWAWLGSSLRVAQAVQCLQAEEETLYLSAEQKAAHEKTRLVQLLKWAKAPQLFPSMPGLEHAAYANIEQMRQAWLARNTP